MFDFQFPHSRMPDIKRRIKKGRENIVKEDEFILSEIRQFIASPERRRMLTGQAYYKGIQDILRRKRCCIGEDGQVRELDNLPNNIIVDNQYKKLVTQKVNYLLSNPFTLEGEHKYTSILRKTLGKGFAKLLQEVCQNSINCGIGWLYVYYNEKGELRFRSIDPCEVVPIWADDEHRRLDYAIRFYETLEYDGKTKKLIKKVEVFDKKGIRRYTADRGRLISDGIEWKTPYFYGGNRALSWERIPLIAFKYNGETPLISNVKSLQDGLNLIVSNFMNAMEEDPRNTILVLKNYDGENLGEFRNNLATYGAVKVRTIDGCDGGVDTLRIEVNSENYNSLIEIFKKAIIENGMGYDAKSDILRGSPNMMNILSMYSDIDIDASGMENEYKDSLDMLIWFINAHLCNTGKGDFTNEEVNIVFNRNIPVNESELINNCIKSLEIISRETVISKHPWTQDSKEELKKIKKEEKEEKENGKLADGNEAEPADEKGNNRALHKGDKQAQGESQKGNTGNKA